MCLWTALEGVLRKFDRISQTLTRDIYQYDPSEPRRLLCRVLLGGNAVAQQLQHEIGDVSCSWLVVMSRVLGH